MSGERIVDLVFSRAEPDFRTRSILSFGFGALVFGFLVALVISSSSQLSDWGSHVSHLVGSELDRLHIVEFEETPIIEDETAQDPEPEREADEESEAELSPEQDPDPEPEPEPQPPLEREEKASGEIAEEQPEYDPEAPAELAQAGSVMGMEVEEGEVVDLTDNLFLTGSGRVYSGGLTSSTGTSQEAVHGRVPTGPPPPAKAETPRRTRNRSRPVGMPHPSWSCPWPVEADSSSINRQTAVIRVAVRGDGMVHDVAVLRDPGYGFGDAARRCALESRFEPARDRSGNPVAAISPPIRVKFER